MPRRVTSTNQKGDQVTFLDSPTTPPRLRLRRRRTITEEKVMVEPGLTTPRQRQEAKTFAEYGEAEERPLELCPHGRNRRSCAACINWTNVQCGGIMPPRY
jgi:hypothetical protein